MAAPAPGDTWPSAGQAPPAVFGRPRPDLFLRTLTVFADAYMGLQVKAREARGRTEPRQPRPGRPHWRKLVVADRVTEADGVVSLRLRAPGGEPLAPWHPGAHVQLELPSGTIRHYSLNGDPSDPACYRVAIRRIDGGGGGSAEIHDTVTEGTVLRVAGPINAFPFAAEPRVLLVAGGIGITPILPMARKAAALGLDWRLVYAGRSRATMPFLTEVSALDGASLDGASAPAGSRVTVLADDEDGGPDAADLIGQAPHGAAVYACGPPPLLGALRTAANAAIDAGRLRSFHFERFTAPPITDGRPFEVELARTGAVLPVPADRSVLDTLRAYNPAVPYSCQQGFCGTCTQRVLRGPVDHRDQRLTPDEREAGDMLVCVSRAAEGERLVLDL
ncbi:MAG: oxidoreductase [Nocardiopsaceae bacterium]|nr:oxidoreductase [Nocardiopsaceae bacterium]